MKTTSIAPWNASGRLVIYLLYPTNEKGHTSSVYNQMLKRFPDAQIELHTDPSETVNALHRHTAGQEACNVFVITNLVKTCPHDQHAGIAELHAALQEAKKYVYTYSVFYSLTPTFTEDVGKWCINTHLDTHIDNLSQAPSCHIYLKEGIESLIRQPLYDRHHPIYDAEDEIHTGEETETLQAA